MIAGALEVQMLANLTRLASDMHQAKGMVGGAMKNIESAVASAKSALGALGVGLGVGYFVSLIKGSIDAADHLRDLSKTLSISVEQLAGLKLAAKQSGGDLDSIAASINKLAQNMGKDAEKFKALGVSAQDPLKAFRQLSDVFVAIQDPQQRAAVMAAALGKSWAGAAPLLSEGGQRIGEMVARGTQLSGVTKDMADQADLFNDKLAELGGTGGILIRLIGPMLPMLNVLADDMLRVREKAEGMTESFSPLAETFKAIMVLGANVTFVFKGIGIELGGIGAQLAALGKGDFAGFSVIPKIMLDDAVAARKELDEYEKKIMGLGLMGKSAPGVASPPGVDPAAAAAASAKAAAFLKGEEDAKKYAQLVKASENYIETLKKETEQIGLNAIQQKMLAASYEALKAPNAALRKEIMQQAQAWAIDTQASLDDAAAKKIQEEGVKRLAEEEKQRLEKLKDAIDADQKQLDAMKLANVEFGKSAQQISEMNLAKLELTLSTLDFAAATWEEVDALEKRLEIARQMVGAAGQNDILRANEAIEKKRREEAKRTAEQIESSLTDALLRGFESGKDFAKNFKDTLINMFKSLVLRPIIQFIVSPISGAITAALGSLLPGMAQASGGGAGGLSGLSSLTSLFGGNSIGQGLMSVGDWMINNNVLPSLGWRLAANAGMIPNWQFGLAGLGGGLLGGAIGGKTGSLLGGIGGGIGMAFGPLGALAGSAIGGVLGKVFGGGGGPKKVGHRLVGELSMEEFTGQGYKLYQGGKQKPYGAGTDYMAPNWGGAAAVSAFAGQMGELLKLSDKLGLAGISEEISKLKVHIDISKAKGEQMMPKFVAAATEAAAALREQLLPAILEAGRLQRDLNDQIGLLSGTTTQYAIDSRNAADAVRDAYAQLGATSGIVERIALEGQLYAAVMQRHQLEIAFFGDLRSTLAAVTQSLATARGQVGQSILDISGRPVMTADALRAAIAGAVSGLDLPSMEGVMVASSQLSALEDAWNPYQGAKATSDAALSAYRALLAGYTKSTYKETPEDLATGTKFSATGYYTVGAQTAQNNTASETYAAAFDKTLETYRTWVTVSGGQTVEQAQTALTAAQEAYADAMIAFTGDSQRAVDALSALREETVRYYDAQRDLASLMSAGASALGQTIADLRRGNLTPVNRYTDLRAEFDALYTGAAGLTGADLARRADQLNTLVQPLMAAASLSYASGPQYQAVLSEITGMLGELQTSLVSTAPRDYQAESISLLSGIDTALGLVQSNLASGDEQIVSAINASKDSTIAVLADIRSLLGGASSSTADLPGHAAGLYSVPYDDYGARLHKDEAVVDAASMRVLRDYGIRISGGGGISAESVAAIVRAIEKNTAATRESAALIARVQAQAGQQITETTREAARETTRGIAGAVEAGVRK